MHANKGTNREELDTGKAKYILYTQRSNLDRKKTSSHNIRNFRRREERKRPQFKEADEAEGIEAGAAEDVILGDAEGVGDPGEGRGEAVEGRGRERVAAGEVDDCSKAAS